jgi:UDP-glucuronate 4-epimerase
MRRDFTYIDDIVDMILRVMDRVPVGKALRDKGNPDAAFSPVPYRIYNLGHGQPVSLMELIVLLERLLGKKAAVKLLPPQPADALETFADMKDTEADIGSLPGTSLDDGIRQFVDWYRWYHESSNPLPTIPSRLPAETLTTRICV